MYPNITQFNYHISYTPHNHINAYIQLSHNSNVTQCKTCDSMHVVPQCEPNVSPLSDSISRIQATLPIRTRSKPLRLFPIKDQRLLRLFPIKDQRMLRLFPIKDQRLCEPTVSPLSDSISRIQATTSISN